MTEPATILVVDDNHVNRAVLFDHLDGQGYRVLVAETGEAAVDVATHASPDVILMDVLLPGIDGYEATRQIRQLPDAHETPILFMSAMEDNSTKSDGLEAGGNAYLTKPVLHDEIESLLDTFLTLQTLKKERNDAPQDTTGGEVSGFAEFDTFIDIIAHDMKSPIVCILGFSEELAADFEDNENAAEEWIEYTSIIRKSSADIDLILEALVLLKNLRARTWDASEDTSLKEILTDAQKRYESIEDALPSISPPSNRPTRSSQTAPSSRN